MFKRLTFEQTAAFYGTLTNLEKVYGKEKVTIALGKMIESLDSETIQKKSNGQQLELLPFEDYSIHDHEKEESKAERNFKFRRRNGENNKIIRTHFYDRDEDPIVAVVQMYAIEAKTQEEIANIIGVKQRAISQFLMDIPEKTKRKIIQTSIQRMGKND